MNPKPLTTQQQTVLTVVTRFAQEHGFPPTLREIGDAIGLPNVNAVRGHLAALEKKGHITRTPDKARSIRLVHVPSRMSRVKRKLHRVLATDEGVFHRVIYGLAWTTQFRVPYLTGGRIDRMRTAIDREAVEHGWTILEARIEPDHVVVMVGTWPNHSAQRTVQRLQAAGKTATRHGSDRLPGKLAWGKGYVVTTDLDLLDEFVVKLLRNEGKCNDRPSRTG